MLRSVFHFMASVLSGPFAGRSSTALLVSATDLDLRQNPQEVARNMLTGR